MFIMMLLVFPVTNIHKMLYNKNYCDKNITRLFEPYFII